MRTFTRVFPRFFGLFLALFLTLGATPSPAEEVAQRLFEMTYTARVQGIPPEARRVELWLPYPVSDEHQRVFDLTVESPYPTELTHDPKLGNAILHLGAMPPNESSFQVRLRFKVLRSEVLSGNLTQVASGKLDGELGHLQRYLVADRLVTLSERVEKIAAENTRGKATLLEKARANYDYVLQHMEYGYEKPGAGTGDTERACDLAMGNCTDYHSLFISLNRASGIPTRFVMGYPLKKEELAGDDKGYHCWSEFYLPGRGWVPVDISVADTSGKTDYYFGNLDPDRVKWSVGRDLLLSPPQRGDRLNYFSVAGYAEVDGHPFGGLSREVSYRTLKRGQGMLLLGQK